MAHSDDFLSPRDHCEICGVELEDEIIIQEFADGSIARLCPECAAGAAVVDGFDHEEEAEEAPPRRKRKLFSRGRGQATEPEPLSEPEYDDFPDQEVVETEAHAAFADQPPPVVARAGRAAAPVAPPPPVAAEAHTATPETVPATYDSPDIEQDILDKTRELLMPVADLIALQGDMQAALERLATSLQDFTTDMLTDSQGKTAVINSRLQALERELEATRDRLRETESLLPAAVVSEATAQAESLPLPEESAPATLDVLVAESRTADAAAAPPAEPEAKPSKRRSRRRAAASQEATPVSETEAGSDEEPTPAPADELVWSPELVPAQKRRDAPEPEPEPESGHEPESEPVAEDRAAARREAAKSVWPEAVWPDDDAAEDEDFTFEDFAVAGRGSAALEAESAQAAEELETAPAIGQPERAPREPAPQLEPEETKPAPAEVKPVAWQAARPAIAADAEVTGTFAINDVQAAQRYYNESAFTNRIKDVRRSLGRPKASLVRLAGQEQQAVLTIFWDIVWYQYVIDLRRDLPSSTPRVILHREGMDLDELAFHFREKNATVNDDGRLDASELEVRLLSDPSALITEMTPEVPETVEDATEEIWEQRISPEFKWDD
jgi:hypothetical protein